MHRCTVACFAHEHQQGHGCLCDTNASRAAIGLPPLHQSDGGHSVHGPLSFPIEREEDDQPLYTPDSAAEPVPGIARGLIGFLVLILLAVSAVALPALLSKGAP